LSKLVVDASTAVLLASMDSLPLGLARFQCVAPPLMWSEALSTLVESAFRGVLPAIELDRAVDQLERLPITAAGGDAEHRRRSLQIATTLGWAKSYDAEYVALAQALACPLLTVDARLVRGAGHLIDTIGPSALTES